MAENGPHEKFLWVPFLHPFPGNEAHKLFFWRPKLEGFVWGAKKFMLKKFMCFFCPLRERDADSTQFGQLCSCARTGSKFGGALALGVVLALATAVILRVFGCCLRPVLTLLHVRPDPPRELRQQQSLTGPAKAFARLKVPSRKWQPKRNNNTPSKPFEALFVQSSV